LFLEKLPSANGGITFLGAGRKEIKSKKKKKGKLRLKRL